MNHTHTHTARQNNIVFTTAIYTPLISHCYCIDVLSLLMQQLLKFLVTITVDAMKAKRSFLCMKVCV